MKIRILFITFFLISCHLQAQNAYMDSLINGLNQPKTGASKRMETYNLLVEQYRISMMYGEASSINKEYIELAKDEKALTEITKAYVNEGVILVNQGKYEKAELFLDSAKISSSKAKDKIASAYSAYFTLYLSKSLGDYKKAMNYGLKSLSLLQNSKSNPLLEFKINYQLYGIYTEWNDLENSKKYAQKAIEAALKSGNKNDLSNAYSAMAVAFTYQYEKTNSSVDSQAILDYCEKAALLYQQFPGQVSGYTYSIARNNKASYLLRYSPKITAEIRNKIEHNIAESLDISSKLPLAQATQTASLGMLSNLAKQDGDLVKAEQYMLKAYSVMLTQNPIYYHIMSRVVSELSDIYEHKDDLKKALEFQKKHNEYKALLFNQSEAEAVKKLEVQYQSEKKEQEILILKERSENQRKQKLLYAGLGLIGTAGAFFMFRSYHFRLRYSMEQERKLITEKHEAELQIKFEKEEQSRLKAEQQLLTFQQQKLKDEVMANQLHIQHKNEILQQLKEKLEDDKSVNLKQIIRDENLFDKDFEKAKFQIQEIHANFFKAINENAKQKLTLLDLKYCAYFYLGMDTKQIANILSVEAKSVRMTKYRLKQKLGLNSKMDLLAYLKNIVTNPLA
ncbi:helix-turn-helix transcriptional regulator [Sphingobacterium tabacisoli]|uniref:LuxR C-terminal-related transcriptional regulator n=1 Tax=Sphingobacterium tabacisoli TaxID=2044855 RepID=A0ABW5L6L6_9SPHI|nr:LuxR C-terminal-related transcriptional regulator [Sphingobacterium tabacisoli]